MPRKIRDLVRDLRSADWYEIAASKHRKFAHPKVPRKVILRGKDGDDADHYLEKQVKDAIRESKESS